MFFDAGELPVFVNVMHGTAETARAAAKGSMRLGICPTCDLVHNVDHEEGLVAYAPGYENSLHGSDVFQAFARELASGLVERHGLRGGHAVEVGGGRGEFMDLLVEAGLAEGLVMDPSSPDDSTRADGPVRIERRLFDRSDVRTAGERPTRLVLTRHVLEHVADPAAFVAMLVDAARAADAGVYVEVPNGLWTLRDLGVWDVIYEHCSYFTPRSLAALFAAADATVRPTELYGGQFLGAETGPNATDGALASAAEHAEAFGAEHARLVETWRGRVEDARSSGRRMAVWGAGSKGATFLNTVDPDGVIVCAVDVNPRKVGRFVAGSGHEVVAPDALASRRVDEIVVMNPLYADEIAKTAASHGVRAEVAVV